MKSNLTFDFVVNKETKTIKVKKEFVADKKLVWDAFTKQEILDQWWAPKPWISKTKYMNFEESGGRFYAMCGPEGEEHWSIQDFTSISPISNFKFIDVFTDKDENINNEMPSSQWDLNFSEVEGITTVDITILHETLADLELIIQMGFQGGFTMTLKDLEKLLLTLKK